MPALAARLSRQVGAWRAKGLEIGRREQIALRRGEIRQQAFQMTDGLHLEVTLH
jgi:hypothetical protein